MTALVPQIASRAAGADTSDVTPLIASATGGDTFPAGPNTWLRVKNGSASPVTVTVTPAASGGPAGTTIAPFALGPVVAATTGDRMYGPFPSNPFADANGNVNVTYAPWAATVLVGVYVFPGA
jgi:hypothetical protein